MKEERIEEGGEWKEGKRWDGGGRMGWWRGGKFPDL